MDGPIVSLSFVTDQARRAVAAGTPLHDACPWPLDSAAGQARACSKQAHASFDSIRQALGNSAMRELELQLNLPESVTPSALWVQGISGSLCTALTRHQALGCPASAVEQASGQDAAPGKSEPLVDSDESPKGLLSRAPPHSGAPL